MTLFLGTVAALSLARLGVWADIKKKAKEKADADTRSNGEAPRSPVLSQVS